jgi:solute carrier family 25 folate transporter 32
MPPPKPTTTTDKAPSIITRQFPNLSIWTAHNLTTAGVNSFSGASAGMISAIATCPLDVIKTKLQNQASASAGIPEGQPRPPPLYKGLVGTAKVIQRQEGLSGFYRGVRPMVLGYIPTWAVYMSVYDSSRQFLYDNGYGEQERDKWFARLYASVTAGFCSTVVTNPIWVIKTRLMSMSAPARSEQGAKGLVGRSLPAYHYTGMTDAASQMWREGGYKVFYSGLVPALLGLSHVAIQFPLYEFFKQRFTGSEMGASAIPSNSSDAASNTVGILAASFLSKLCATTATYPHEVLRTRQQTQLRSAQVESGSSGVGLINHSMAISRAKRIGSSDGMTFQPKYKGVVQTFRHILAEESWLAFYNGMGTNMIRTLPAAMTTMLAFETIKTYVGQVQEEGRELVGEGR